MEKFLTIVKEMKVVIFDMYGVINFGSGVSPTVLQTLKTLREDGKIVIILSNASFGSADAVSKYAKKGMFKGVHYDDVVTSGQFGYEAIQRGDVPVPGTTMYVFGTANFKRPEDKLPDLFKDSVYLVTEDMEKADFAYCGVPQIHGEDRMDIDDFIPELEKSANVIWKWSVPIRTCALTKVVNLLSGKVLFVRLFGRWGAKPSFTASRILRFLTGH